MFGLGVAVSLKEWRGYKLDISRTTDVGIFQKVKQEIILLQFLDYYFTLGMVYVC
jgi:hypothetical protein